MIRGKHLREANSVRTKQNGTLPVRINGRSLVKKIVCNAFAVAHDEMEAKDLQMDEVRAYVPDGSSVFQEAVVVNMRRRTDRSHDSSLRSACR